MSTFNDDNDETDRREIYNHEFQRNPLTDDDSEVADIEIDDVREMTDEEQEFSKLIDEERRKIKQFVKKPKIRECLTTQEKRNWKLIHSERMFRESVKRPKNVYISEFTQVRWKNLSKKVKAGFICFVVTYLFMAFVCVSMTILIPLIIQNTNGARDLRADLDRFSKRLDKANEVLNAIESDVETVNGYTTIKQYVLCMREFFIGWGKGTDEYILKQNVNKCLVNIINI